MLPPPTIESVQKRLIEYGYLDPPSDGVFGSVSQWALGVALGESKPELKPNNIDDYVHRLDMLDPLPLKPGDDFAGMIVRAMQSSNYWVARHPTTLNIVYVEGVNSVGKANDNMPNHFNDLRLLIRVGVDGVPAIAGSWEATTEPSRYWTINPMNEGGAFHIAIGQHKAWVRGEYHDIPALVQVSDISGYRDPNKTFRRDYKHPVRGVFGVHHHGGYDLPHDEMGRSSAGCLVGRSTTGHDRFMALTKTDARYCASHTYKYMTTIVPQMLHLMARETPTS